MKTCNDIHMNITKICRTLRNNACEVFYHENTFSVSLHCFSELQFQIPLIGTIPQPISKCSVEAKLFDERFQNALPTYTIQRVVSALCNELRRFGTKNIFIAYHDVDPARWSRFELNGPRYYTLDPLTSLHGIKIESSGLSPHFSKYLTLPSDPVELGWPLKELREILHHVRAMCTCSDYLGHPWECIRNHQDLNKPKELDDAWQNIVMHRYKSCASIIDYDNMLQNICRYIDQGDDKKCRWQMDVIWKDLRDQAKLLESRWTQARKRVENALPYQEMLERSPS